MVCCYQVTKIFSSSAWIHWVTRSCTTTAYRWLFRDSQLSLRTLWSAVIKSPKLSARGTASSLRLLHGALVGINVGTRWWFYHTESCRLTDFQNTRKFWFDFIGCISLDLPRVTKFWLFLLILRGIAGVTGVSNFLRAFLMVILNSLSSGSMK